MGIQNYSLLKGDPQPGKVSGRNPHFRIPVNIPGGMATIDVNIQSVDGSEVLYAVLQNTPPPNADALLALADGQMPIPSEAGGFALDFVRTQIDGAPMIAKDALQLLPSGGNQDLHDQIVTVVNQAIADENGLIYAFGSFFDDGSGVEGIHDIHMNQGNPLNNHGGDNGIFQVGALFVFLPATSTWISVFIAFQTQSWNTDDSGNPE
jgi:uncharacterized protein YukJ